MYCPKCGTQNFDNIKFCRSCGENLTIVSQAMKRRLPVFLASKLDAHIARKNERMRRDGIVASVSAVIFFVFAIKGLLTGDSSTTVIVHSILALIFSTCGVWELAAFNRSKDLDAIPPAISLAASSPV